MIDPMLEKLISLFSPAEWRAVIFVLLSTIATTHLFKVLWRWLPIKGGGNVGVNVLAIVSGFIAAYTCWPDTGSIPWYMAGVIAGPASSLVFKVAFWLLKKYLPGVALGFNVDRRRKPRAPTKTIPINE